MSDARGYATDAWRERPTAMVAHYASGALALVTLTLWACSGGASETGPKASSAMRIVAGASGTDTISGTLNQALTVSVEDEAAHPIAGALLSVTCFPVGGALLAHPGDSTFTTALLDTADADGRASVRIRLGTLAETTTVIVRDASLGLADSAHYWVKAGNPAKMELSPMDTAVFPSTAYALHATVRDRAGNSRSGDAVGYSVASGPAHVNSTSGAVTTTDFGRVMITARSGDFVDTAQASVVPHVWVAAQQYNIGNGSPIGIFLMLLDGSQQTPLAGPIDNAFVSGQGFGWSPDGQTLAIARGDSVDLVVPGSNEARLIGWNSPVLLGARYSRDGQWIYYARAGQGIFRVHPDGNGEQHLGYGGTEWGDDWRPSPSGDGSAVVYGSDRSPCDQTYCIRVLDIASGAENIIGNGSTAAWSPVSDLIASANGAEIDLVHSDGSGRRVLGTLDRYITWMDWSPDGRWLLVSAGLGPVDLFDTTNGAELPLASFVTFGAAAWRPDAASSGLESRPGRIVSPSAFR
jgi:anaphase-promoting complex subunit 4